MSIKKTGINILNYVIIILLGIPAYIGFGMSVILLFLYTLLTTFSIKTANDKSKEFIDKHIEI